MEVGIPEPSMQLLAEAAETQPPAPIAGAHDAEQDDSRSSSLSEPEDGPATEPSEANDETAAPSEDDDTEAETERLENSPEKQRKQRKVLLSADAEASNGTAMDIDGVSQLDTGDRAVSGDVEEDGEGQGDEANAQTSDMSSPAMSAEPSDQEEPRLAGGRKRKREDDDTTAKSLKKVALELANHVADQEEGTEEIASPQGSASGNEEVPGEEDELSGNEDQAEEQAEDDQVNGDNQEALDAVDSNADEVDGDDGALDATSAARTREELEKRKAAHETLSSIERDFALLRDKLFADRSSQLAQEMAMIDADSPTHPMYLSVLGYLNQLREEKIQHAKILFKYKFGALQKRSISNRAAAQSQYVQKIRELRDETLEKASAEWYQIQRERRNFDTDKEVPVNHFNGDRIQWVATQTAYNTEVSILSGIGKHVGFPAAPDIIGAKTTEIEDDLRKMGITRQAAVPPLNPSLSQATKAKPGAEEQFIAENAWANPQHQQSQYLTNIHRKVSTGLRPTSPVNTPVGQKHPLEQVPNGSASTIAALPTSSIGPTPMSSEVPPATNRNQDHIPDSTPSKPPEPIQPAISTAEPRPISAGFAEEDGIAEQPHPQESAARDISSINSDAGRRNAASPNLLPSQALKNTPQNDRIPAQFPQGASLPPVKVGSV